MRSALAFVALLAAVPMVVSAQSPDSAVRIVDAQINRYCHEPDQCVLRGALLWDTTNVAPRYPEVMRSVGIHGEVELRFMVQPDGTVDGESIVIERATNRAFEQFSLNAARQWKFRIESQDKPITAVPTALTILYALADRCPAGMSGPLTSLASVGQDTRLIVMVCGVTGPPTH